MPVDPEIQALLDKGTGVPDTSTLSVVEARRLYEARVSLMVPGPEMAWLTEAEMAGPGGPLGLRIYGPEGARPLPLIVFFHGSGFVLCSLETHDGMCRHLAAGIGAVVVSVDYRLTPEHKFPAGPDDCLAATRWAAENAGDLGADPSRILIAGDSAGGTMAAVTALRVRDEGGPPLAGQMLLYPVTDYYEPGTASYAENGEGYGLTTATMKWFWDHYLNDGAEAADPLAAPLRARSLAGLPAAYVMSAEYDPLRDEAEGYGDRLAAEGVATEMTRREGMNHGFLFWVGRVVAADAAMAHACAWGRRVLG